MLLLVFVTPVERVSSLTALAERGSFANMLDHA
jgi:hypothetical protein